MLFSYKNIIGANIKNKHAPHNIKDSEMNMSTNTAKVSSTILTLDHVTFDKSRGIISSYNSEFQNIIIPEHFDSVPVKYIDANAFQNKALINVVMPNTSISIGYEAFKENDFSTVAFPNQEISINHHAFDDGVVKVFNTNNPNCLSFQDDALNIRQEYRNSIVNEINVKNVDSIEGLHEIADAYIKLSKRIDDNRANFNVSIDDSALQYSIYVITKDGLCNENFFERFITHPDLELKAVNFVNNVIVWCQQHNATIWQDDEKPLAEHAAYILAMHDEKHIPLYCDVLTYCDMEHECYQSEHIEALISKHGLCKNILTLIALRLGSARGQWGNDHVCSHKDELIELFTNDVNLKTLFLNTVVKSINESHEDFEELFEYLDVVIEGDNVKWLEKQLQQLA